ncbi:MAG TPA: hypothetical protein VGL53_26705 [Bryobacteraceae bacterium]
MTITSPEPERLAGEASQEKKATTCPTCGCADVRQSSARRAADLLPSNRNRVPFRCRGCRGRFHVNIAELPQAFPAASPPRKSSHHHRNRTAFLKGPQARRILKHATIVGASLAAFAAFLYLLAAGGPPS